MWQLTDQTGHTISEHEALEQARQAKRDYWQLTGRWAEIGPCASAQEPESGTRTENQGD